MTQFLALPLQAEPLTSEQESFLAECEREFADRYSERDKEYTDFKARQEAGPPCVYPWRPPRQDHHRCGRWRALSNSKFGGFLMGSACNFRE